MTKGFFVCQSLVDQKDLTPHQKRRVASLAKKFSPTRIADVERARSLLFSLYGANNMPAVNQCIEILTQISFKGDYRIWNPDQSAYCLKFYLSDDEQEKQRIQSMLWEEVRSPHHDDEKHQEYLRNVMDGLVLEMRLRSLEEYSDTERDEYEVRTVVLSAYLQILALGARGRYQRDEVLEAIEAQTARLRELYKNLKGRV